MRKGMITASDFAQALGDGKFGSQKQFFRKKCAFEEEKFNPNVPPLKWGVMFEPIACEIYERRNGVKVHEFGLLPHPNVKFFGASPDGITELGIMLEIKCPYKRKITGEVPLQYYYQIQGQLDVCGLDECDYLECEFQEYSDSQEFLEDFSKVEEKGIVIEYQESPTNVTSSYKYSRIVSSKDSGEAIELLRWADEESKKGLKNVKLHYWKLHVYNVVRVYRNEAYIQEKLEQLAIVWDRVNAYQANKELYLKEVGPSTTSKRSNSNMLQTSITGYSFLDDH